jgi:hypothetical protein
MQIFSYIWYHNDMLIAFLLIWFLTLFSFQTIFSMVTEKIFVAVFVVFIHSNL